MAKKQKAYFGIESRLVNILLAIFFGPLLGMITAFLRGNMLAGVIRLISLILVIGIPIFWIIDLVTIILYKDVTILA